MTDQARAAYEARSQVDANDPAEAESLALFVAGYEDAVAAHGDQSAPAGFVMVPVEPTAEMVQAAFEKVELNGFPGYATGNEARRAIYAAMLAAAPAQPAAGLVGLTEATSDLCDAVDGMLEWCVKNVNRWNFGAYDTLNIANKRARIAGAAHPKEQTP